ncbi:MAG: patatin-like phospholipase family protein [Candidatus Omnitrophica bacterium]|nr:patatin-like phospholipase family protein [Candidatus Omnitrophota bacterium]
MSGDMTFLRDLPLFSGVSQEILDELTPLLMDLRVQAGGILCEQGMIGTRMLLIQTGQVRITVAGDDGEEQVLGFLGPGDPVGEMSVLSGEPMSANAIATVETHLKTIDGETFLDFCDKHPILYRRMLRILAERIRMGNRRMFTPHRGRVGWIFSGLNGTSTVVDGVLEEMARLFAAESKTRPLLVSVSPETEKEDSKSVGLRSHDSNDSTLPCRDMREILSAEIPELKTGFKQEWSGVEDAYEVFVLSHSREKSHDEVTSVLGKCVERLRPDHNYILVNHPQRSLENLLLASLPDDNVVALVDLTQAGCQVNATREEYDAFIPEPHRYPAEGGENHWVIEPKIVKALQSLADSVKTKGAIEVVLVHSTSRPILDYSRVRKIFEDHSVHCFPIADDPKDEAEERLEGRSFSLALGKAPIIAKRRAVRELAHAQVGLALGGGGARGMAHIGVIKTLEEEGIPIDMVAGSSMGGIVAAVYAQGRPGSRLLSDTRFYWANLGNFLFDLLDYDFPRTNLLRGRKIKRIIKSVMEGIAIEECQIPLALACTDLLTGKQVVLEEGNLGDAIIATGALPGIFRPVRWGKHLLVDGAVIDKVPARVLQKKGAKFIISVNVTPENDPHLDASGRKTHIGLRKAFYRLPLFRKWAEEPNILQVITRSLEVSGVHQSRSQIDLVDVEIKPRVEQFDFLRFDQFDQIVEAGASAAREAAPAIRELLQNSSQ